MTPEAQLVAMAEACGWEWCDPFNKRKQSNVLRPPIGRSDLKCVKVWKDGSFGGGSLPDYLNDLNAMHEAEKIMDRHQKNRYLNILHSICLPDDCDELEDDFGWCTATASQRAEAFLKTFSLWKDSTP